jgi:hypothetical protein
MLKKWMTMPRCTYVNRVQHIKNDEKLYSQKGESPSVEESTRYICVVGAVRYLTLTRIDISFPINKVINIIMHKF